MKPDQYQFPTQPETQLTLEAEPLLVGDVDIEAYDPLLVAEVDAAYGEAALAIDTPERVLVIQRIKEIEAHLDALRAEATEANLPQRTALEQAMESLRNVLASRSRQPLKARLIEAERDLSGRLFSQASGTANRRFWYDHSDWLYEETDASGNLVALYKFENDLSYKLVDGRSIQFAPGEEAALFATIKLYYALVQVELYSDKADWALAA